MTAAHEITRDDLESKFRELKGEVGEVSANAGSYAVAVAAVVVIGIAGLAYMVGRRRGRKKTTVVEIRRV